MPHRFFLYGTLKRGESNYPLLTEELLNCRAVPPAVVLGQPAVYLGRAVTGDKWPLVIAGKLSTPFLLDCKGHGKQVSGEVFELDDQKLGLLDYLEMHPHVYQRDTLPVLIVEDRNGTPIAHEKQQTEMCHTYFLREYRPEILLQPHLEEYSGPRNDPRGKTTFAKFENATDMILHFSDEVLST